MVWGEQESRSRGKEGCALHLSPLGWEDIEAHRQNRSIIVRVVEKTAIVKYAWVCG